MGFFIMGKEIITLGENLNPPTINMPTTQAVYDCVRDDEFNVATFNSLLFAVVTYLDKHDVEYCDSGLPWAEVMKEV